MRRTVSVWLVVLGTLALSAFLAFGVRFAPEVAQRAGGAELALEARGNARIYSGPALPGVVMDRCVEVVFTGSAPAAEIRLFVSDGGLVDSGLAGDIDLTVEVGSSGSVPDCAGFQGDRVYTGSLADFVARHHSMSSGTGVWIAESADDSRVYRISMLLQSDPGPRRAEVTFTWEATHPPAASGRGMRQ